VALRFYRDDYGRKRHAGKIDMFNLRHLRTMCSSAKALGLNLPDTGRWLWSYYASRLPGARLHDAGSTQIEVRDRAGKKHGLIIRNNGHDWVVVDEIFVRHLYRLDMADAGHILDLGGNIGLATLWFAWSFPGGQICTVEPIPDNVSILERNVRLNRVAARVVASAVGPADGKTRFILSEDPRQHSNINTGQGTEKTIEVDVLSVPSLMAVMGWEDIDLLKIDIEGGEKEVLAGRPPWLMKVRCIVGEGHFGVGYTIDACRRDLEPMGFHVEQVDENGGAWMFLARRPDRQDGNEEAVDPGSARRTA
jgi:FkbM family methyltransferase